MNNKLSNGSKELGFPLSDEELRKFGVYLSELLKWSAKVNLTAIVEPEEIVVKHFLDSLALLRVLPFAARLSQTPAEPESRWPDRRFTACDIGSGAGLPGLALKIALPEMNITLIEPARKKAVFLRHVIRALGLSGVEVVEARAEELKAQAVDMVFSRAFKGLPEILAVAGAMLKRGGYVAQSLSLQDAEALNGNMPGWEIAREEEITLPFSDIRRRLILLKKSTVDRT